MSKSTYPILLPGEEINLAPTVAKIMGLGLDYFGLCVGTWKHNHSVVVGRYGGPGKVLTVVANPLMGSRPYTEWYPDVVATLPSLSDCLDWLREKLTSDHVIGMEVPADKKEQPRATIDVPYSCDTPKIYFGDTLLEALYRCVIALEALLPEEEG